MTFHAIQRRLISNSYNLILDEVWEHITNQIHAEVNKTKALQYIGTGPYANYYTLLSLKLQKYDFCK